MRYCKRPGAALGRNRLGVHVHRVEPAIERDATFLIRNPLHSQPVDGGRLQSLRDDVLFKSLIDLDETSRQGVSRLFKHLPLTGSRA